MKYKYAFFDFCETLVDLQTADDYISDVIIKKEGRWSYKLAIIGFLRNRWVNKLFNKLFNNYDNPKSLILKLVKGFDYGVFSVAAEEYCKKLMEYYLIDDVISEMLELKKKNYQIIIVSGGYDIYIKHFFFSVVDKVIATEIDFSDSKCLGKISGIDCLGVNKLNKIKKYIDVNTIDYENSYVFSDSKTDLPLFSLAKNKIVISKKKNKSWVNEQNEEFIEKVWCPKKIC